MERKQNKYADLAQPKLQLDLHGVHVSDGTQIQRLLDDLVARGIAAGESKVLVITGKGIHSEGGTPRIKPYVSAYLARHPRVQWVRHARQDMGGAGALEVKLR